MMIAKLLLSEQEKRDENKETLLDNPHYISIKELFVNKLKVLAFLNKEILLENKSLLTLLYRWKEWGEIQDINNWIDLISTNFQYLLKFLFQCIQYSTSFDGKVSKKHYYIKVGNINDFYDVKKIEQIINSVDKSKLSTEEIYTIKLFNEGITKFRNGNEDNW